MVVVVPLSSSVNKVLQMLSQINLCDLRKGILNGNSKIESYDDKSSAIKTFFALKRMRLGKTK